MGALEASKGGSFLMECPCWGASREQSNRAAMDMAMGTPSCIDNERPLKCHCIQDEFHGPFYRGYA